MVALVVGQSPGRAEGTGLIRGLDPALGCGACAGQHCAQPLATFAHAPPEPEPTQGPGKAQAGLDWGWPGLVSGAGASAAFQRPVQHYSQVVMLGLQPLEPRSLIRAAKLLLCLLCHVEVVG